MPFNRSIISCVIIIVAFGCESDTAPLGGTGQGGSMSRFAINGHYLYVVDQSALNVFNIVENNFVALNVIIVGPGIETFFAKGEYLYLGARDAMYIWSIANPELPKFIFRYTHMVSCDPVVVQGDRAYVTLRTRGSCNVTWDHDALEILDISNPYEPKLVAEYTMQTPRGLAVDGKWLFICEGDYGFKVFDIQNEKNIQLTRQITDIFAYDAIAREGLLTVTGEDGIFQYHYQTQQINGILQDTVELVSKIPVYRGAD